ncbi:hypothetical protein CYPRO_2548 [Cyclonatronum proteinivorum]|uniref:Uncharacterized protein n=1 Tax=Cyclonatronum proteinivorum TaxID=1457365 RepID=A0A345UMT8_9BACT|nr:hypothetical protein [Cyclonatronum proteinivorum]AXJ01790.1 hypothetical protein CYPRO_2548 [Cyclonatronum proteinivorum]
MSQASTERRSPEEVHEERIRLFIEIQLGQGAKELGFAEQRQKLTGKFRKVMLMMALNFGFVLFFTLSFYYEITQLSTVWFNLIVVFFLINVIFYFFQHRKLKEANAWLDEKIKGQQG